jgi:uncharacterized protein (DUF1778 family)
MTKSVMIGFRMPTSEREELHKAAKHRNIKLSDYLRECANQLLQKI